MRTLIISFLTAVLLLSVSAFAAEKQKATDLDCEKDFTTAAKRAACFAAQADENREAAKKADKAARKYEPKSMQKVEDRQAKDAKKVKNFKGEALWVYKQSQISGAKRGEVLVYDEYNPAMDYGDKTIIFLDAYQHDYNDVHITTIVGNGGSIPVDILKNGKVVVKNLRAGRSIRLNAPNHDIANGGSMVVYTANAQSDGTGFRMITGPSVSLTPCMGTCDASYFHRIQTWTISGF